MALVGPDPEDGGQFTSHRCSRLPHCCKLALLLFCAGGPMMLYHCDVWYEIGGFVIPRVAAAALYSSTLGYPVV